MLTALIVVLRETLEASFLISLMLIYSSLFEIKYRRLLAPLVLAAGIAFWLADNMLSISEWFDGIGQEVLFSAILFFMGCSLIIVNSLAFYLRNSTEFTPSCRLLITLLMGFCIVCAASLEGSEIIIYYQSAKHQPSGIFGATVGSLLGSGIGFSIGVVFFYSVRFFAQQFYIALGLLILISAGMFSQSIALLTQAGIVDAGQSVWNSDFLVEENSLTGQLLYALIGYESTPSFYQALTYGLSIFLPCLVIFLLFRLQRSR